MRRHFALAIGAALSLSLWVPANPTFGQAPEFEQVPLPTAQGKQFTTLTIGPDGKLYGTANDGEIRRWTLNADGTTGPAEIITSLRDAEGGDRLLIGLAFDPASNAGNLIAWVSHSTYGFSGMADWGGKISRMSGPNLEVVQTYVINLPRSSRDHVTNGLSFGPDGLLYFLQGSNSTMGAPDAGWANRRERLLNAAVLRLDPSLITTPPLDAKTEYGGTYNPYAPGAPLTIYATGTRNPYDLVWHSKGQLYVTANGSAAGGNTPEGMVGVGCADGSTYAGPYVPPLTGTSLQKDFLFRIEEGGYYGHPNPLRCEFVANGGNPTSGSDPAEVGDYPVGVLPDENYLGFAYDHGFNVSPDGIIEYRHWGFGGALQHKLLGVRYSNGDDIIVLTPGAPDLDIVEVETDITGLTGFYDPLDLVEDPSNGNLYLSQYSDASIILLRPIPVGPADCSPISPLTCPEVPVTLPYSLTWSASEGGLLDGDTDGTGFTMVDPPSNGGTGYLPANLNVDTAAGTLAITTTAGIQFQIPALTTGANTLDNGLGVGFDADAQDTRIETNLTNLPSVTGQSQQAGLWFFLDEDDYVKLVVLSAASGTYKVQALWETGGIAQTPELNTGNIVVPGDSIRLVMDLDPATNQVACFYDINNTGLVSFGTLTVGASLFSGVLLPDGLTGPVSFAGIFATHRNGPSSLVYTFTDFSMEDLGAVPTCPFTDDFNRADSSTVGNGWVEVENQTTDCAIVSNQCQIQDQGPLGQITQSNINTAGLSSITFSYDWRDDGTTEAGDLLISEWKLSSSGTWNTLGSHTLTQPTLVNASFNLPAAAENTSIDIRFRITVNGNNEGAFVDNVMVCGASPCTAPTVTGDPSNQSVCQGGTATFTVTATGTAPLSYQWFQDASPVGTNSPTLMLTNVQPADNGDQITCQVSNTCGNDTSAAATLSVQSAPTSNAGSDQTICAGAIANVSGTASNAASTLWSTSGTGVFGDANMLATTYTPSAADITAGSVTLTLTANPIAPCAAAAQDSLVLTIQANPTANAGSDQTICSGDVANVSGTASNAASTLWSTSGTGVFGDANILATTYTPSAADITAGSVTLTLTANPIAPCATAAQDSLVLTIQANPTANAGADQTICAGDVANVSGTASNAASTTWGTSGDGVFGDANMLATTYTPGAADITAGSVTLTLTANPIAPCATAAQDSLVLTIQANATANAGADQTICAGQSANVSGTASNAASTLWSTSGDGVFGNAAMLATTYTPGAADIAAGSVTLTLTANPIAPCATAAQDSLVLTINANATADAGADQTICNGDDAQLAGAAGGASSTQWMTSGDGTFDDAGLLNAVYTPGAADLAAGTVTLTLTANPVAPCVTAAQDSMVVTIQANATAGAGSDQTICAGDVVNVSGTASNAASTLWSTSGTGVFGDAGMLATTYTPSAADITAGSVTLTLTANPIAPCATAAQDSLVVTIQANATANAGSDQTICAGAMANVSGTVSNAASTLWSTSGTGVFGNASMLATTYTPSAADITAGSVTLTLTANPIAPCSTAAQDSLVLTIQANPTANAGADQTICNGDDVQLAGSASGASSTQWTSGGDGTFDDAGLLNAVYTPGAADIAAGTVTLTLTANPVAPCVTAAQDSMVVTINADATADAGADQTVCAGDDVQLAGSAAGASSTQWTTGGDGTFDDAGLLNAVYTPGAADIAAGTVTLTLTANRAPPCVTAAQDSMVVTINANATANAGADQTICTGDDVQLAGSAGGASSTLWTTGGDGTFDDAALLSAVYTPGAGDIAAGMVTLTLTANPAAPCTTAAQDSMLVTIDPPPRIELVEVFYAGKFANAADPSKSLLATGGTATNSNISNTVFGITGVRITFDTVVTFATTPADAFSFEWTTGSGTVFSAVPDVALNFTITSMDPGGQTVVDIVIANNFVKRRWLKVTCLASQVSLGGSCQMDGELSGNPMLLPSGDGMPGGDAICYIGNVPGDVDADQKTLIDDAVAIRAQVNPFVNVPITNVFDVDKDGKVLINDAVAARAEVNPFFTLPLITP